MYVIIVGTFHKFSVHKIPVQLNPHNWVQNPGVINIQFAVLWVVTPCSVAVVYQRFGGSCCFHLQVVTSCIVMW